MNTSQHLSLAISLPLQNQAQLTEFLKELGDPASANYRHFLTPAEFTEKFGPSKESYAAVVEFAKANGLTVTGRHSNRLIVDVEGAVSDIENAFHVTMNTYQHPTEKRTFYAPDREPTVDASTSILRVSGLDNYEPPRPRYHNQQQAANAVGAVQSNGGSGPNGGYMGSDFRTAYAPGVALTGTGQTIGLLEFDGYAAGDITYYEGKAGLPNVPLTNVLLDGFSGTPTGNGGEVEVSLDIEVAVSLAPGASSVMVYEAGPSGNWHDILNRIATDNKAKQISCSWYSPGEAADPVADQIFQQMAAQGQSFFAASGDYDAFTGLIPFPGDTPYITEVGGTTLTTGTAGGTWSSETVWNWNNGIGSGGGISTQYAIPTWQRGISMSGNQGSTTMRNVPDVALTADNVYVRADGKDQRIGGTSCAAPLWAAFIALVNQQSRANGLNTVGFINPAIYTIGKGSSYTNDFHDITTGNNYSYYSPSSFAAATGYDLCTGWGTPAGTALINALSGTPDNFQVSTTVFSSSGVTGGPFTPATVTYTLTNTKSTTLSWGLGATQSWLSLSALGGTLGGYGTVQVTASINSNAGSLTTGNYSDTITFRDITTGINQTRGVNLTVSSANPVLSVTPGTGFSPTGKAGGPFTPSSGTYTITNTGNGPMSWMVSNTSSWMSVSPTSGTLAVGGNTPVVATITAGANSLSTGNYADTMVFTNLSNGHGNTTRAAALTVLGSPVITSSTSAFGAQGVVFSYQIAATGNPTNFGVSSLPTGLVLNGTTGLISGTPLSTGTSSVVMSATNAAGSGSANLTINVVNASSISTGFGGFAVGSNPTAGGYWRFGYSTTLGGAFNLYTVNSSGTGGFTSIWSSGTGNYPNVIKNITGSDWVDSNNVLYLGNDYLAMNPGSGKYTITRWTAPSSGTYQVAATFESLREASPNVTSDIHVLYNSTSIFDGVFNDLQPLSQQLFARTMSVNAGDTIDFVVGPGVANNYLNDSTGLEVSVAPLGSGPALLKTGRAMELTVSSAVLEGSVNLNTTSGTAYFQYGTTSSYGSVTAPQTVASGTSVVTATGTASGLALNTLYHYRVAVVTTSGTSYGLDQSFTTFFPSTVNDTFNDYSYSINPGPSGTWSYGNTATLGGTFNLYTSIQSDGIIEDWYAPNGQESVLKNITGSDYTYTGDYIFVPASKFIQMDPGEGQQFSVTRWTAAATGTYQISTTFQSARVGVVPTTTYVYVLKSGSSIFKGGLNNYLPWSDQNYTRTIVVNAGETIDFVVGVGADMSNNYDSTDVRGTIMLMGNPGLDVGPLSGFASSGPQGGPFTATGNSYTLTNSENGPINWTASGTSAWLTLSQPGGTLASGSSVTITATVNSNANSLSSGTYADTMSFINTTDGNGNTTLPATLTVLPPPPVISGSLATTGIVGYPYSYQITASNNPTSYAVSGSTPLPSGLSLNSSSGLISGTPTTSGTSNVTISAINTGGSGSATLTITILQPSPVITSASSVTGLQGQAFSYQITATGNPTNYGASGLPGWLTLNPATGLISGTATSIGTTNLIISATNAIGSGSAPLTINVISPETAENAFLAFSTASNPSGLWKYGYTTSVGGALNLYTVSSTGNGGTTAFWSGTASAPNVTKNISGTDWTDSNNVLYPGSDYLNMSPGSGQYSVARWTAPTTGTYQVAATFESLREASPAVTSDIHVLYNNTSIFDGVFNNLQPLSQQLFARSMSLNAGDTIDFVVGPGTANNYLNDSTGLEVSVAPLTNGTITLKTGRATELSALSAALEGSVNLSTTSGTVYFQYGTTSSYGSVTAPQAVANGTSVVTATGTATGLTLNTLYHYRAVAVTASGTAYGLDQMFTTFTPATVNDAFNDYSYSVNPSPSGVWSYGNTTTLGGTFNLYTSIQTDGVIEDWYAPSGQESVLKNVTGSDYTYTSIFIFVPASKFIQMDPGEGQQFSVTRWTAAATGTYQIATTFQSARVGAAPVTTYVYVLKSGSSIFKGGLNNYLPWSDQCFTRAMVLNAGDTIDFVVGVGADMSNGSDSTDLRGTITLMGNPGLSVGAGGAGSFASSGTVGGPFVPASGTYTLTNTENGPINWTASGTSTWLTLSQSGGTLASGSSVTITATVNSNANSFSTGTYADTMSFTNTTDGLGSTTIPATLTVLPPVPVITSPLSATGTNGMAFVYQITASNNPTSYAASGLPSWLSLNTTTGSMSGTPTAPGASNVIISASNALGSGSANLTINIASAAGSFNAFSSFSSGTNPSGYWRYGSSTTLGGTFNLFTVNSSGTGGTTNMWSSSAINSYPSVIKNVSGSDWVDSNNVLYPGSDSLVMNSGSGQYSITRWTTPTSGTYQIAATFESLREASPNVTSDIHVLYNSVSIFDGVFNNLQLLSQQLFARSMSLNAGDTIDFVVGSGTANNYLNDSTGLEVSVAPLKNGTITLKTGRATELTTVSAALEGSVNLSTTSGSAYFQYGTTSSYGSVTAPQAVASGTSVVTATGTANGLAPNTLYHYCAVAVTSSGTSYGLDQTFTTFTPSTVNDAFNDYSYSVNPSPSGVWSYGNTTTLGGTFNLYTSIQTDGVIEDWYATSGQESVLKNVTGSDYTYTSSLIFVPASKFIQMDPGSGKQFSVTRWTAMASGTYQIATTYQSARVGAAAVTTYVYVLKSGSSIFKGGLNNYLPWSDQCFTRAMVLNAGDTIDFVVGVGADMSNGSDSTDLRGTITLMGNPGLNVSPLGSFASSGTVGGPFAPASGTYTLLNEESGPINWTASGTSEWLTMTPSSGTLAPGSSMAVVASVNANANTIGITGTYNDTMSFINTTDGAGSTAIPATLIVLPPLAPVITSPLSASGTNGVWFCYQISGSNNPTSYGASPLPSGLDVNNSTGVISGTAAVSGTYNVTLSATNAGGSGTATLVLALQSPYANWQQQTFTAQQAVNASTSGDLATPAGDGIPNLLKYALNLNPMTNGSGGLPVIGTATDLSSNTYLTLTYTRVIANTDLNYIVEVSNDLKTWNSGPDYTTTQSVTNNADGVTQTVVVQENLPIGSGGSESFMRLRVTGP